MRPARLVPAMLAAMLTATPALAGSVIEIVHPWARPTIPGRPGVAYFAIHNPGDAPDRLLGARADHARTIELHRSEDKGGVMTMAPAGPVEIPPGGMANFDPGGLHLMLFDLDPPLAEGETMGLTLIFESAGEITVSVPVSRTAPEAQHGGGEPGHGSGAHGGDHGPGTTGN